MLESLTLKSSPDDSVVHPGIGELLNCIRILPKPKIQLQWDFFFPTDIAALWFLVLSLFLWRRQWQLSPVFLPGKSHGWRSPGRLGLLGVGYN